jgi:uncharacterized protein
MDITPLIKQGQQVIQSYAGGRFRINGQIFAHAVIVFPNQTLVWDVPLDFNDLAVSDFNPLIPALGYLDIILLGTGKTMMFLPVSLRKSLKDQGLSLDVMDTGAACRTYNVLMAEGRRVACALMTA